MKRHDPRVALKTKRSTRAKRSHNQPKNKFMHFTQAFSKVFSRGEITQNSIVIAYYLLLSIFPIIIIAGNLLPLFNISTKPIANYLAVVFPKAVQSFIMPIIESLLSNPSGGFISFGILIAIWAFSRLINSLRISMNKIYGVWRQEKKMAWYNTILRRVLTFFTTATLVLGLMLVVFVIGFGQQIIEFLAPIFKFSTAPFHTFMSFRWPLILILMTVVIAYIDYFIPNINLKHRSLWPGVLVTLVGWVVLAMGFSLYLKYFGTSFSNYGIVGTFIIFMLWLNFSSLVMLIGVVVNATIDQDHHGRIDYNAGRIINFVERRANGSNSSRKS